MICSIDLFQFDISLYRHYMYPSFILHDEVSFSNKAIMSHHMLSKFHQKFNQKHALLGIF
jgi:hypothetical protein